VKVVTSLPRASRSSSRRRRSETRMDRHLRVLKLRVRIEVNQNNLDKEDSAKKNTDKEEKKAASK
jgi:AFG3 family protein